MLCQLSDRFWIDLFRIAGWGFRHHLLKPSGDESQKKHTNNEHVSKLCVGRQKVFLYLHLLYEQCLEYRFHFYVGSICSDHVLKMIETFWHSISGSEHWGTHWEMVETKHTSYANHVGQLLVAPYKNNNCFSEL